MPRERDGSDEVADLRAVAAELERRFAGYKQRLAERNGDDDDDDASGGGGGGEAEPGGCDGGGDVRGRMYEAYARRRDERLRRGWRARMERKEAEVKALWAQLDLSSRAAGGDGGGERAPAGGGPATTTDPGTAAGDEEEKTERDDDDDKKRSSDAALAPRRISGKKHARTRSFSSSTNTGRNHRPDVGRRRAQSQEPPPSEPRDAGAKESRARPAPATTTAATLRPKTSLRRKNTVKVHGSAAKQTGPKLRRSPPRRASSGGAGLEDLSKEAVLPSADAAAPLPRRSFGQDVRGETPEASPPRPSTSVLGVGADDAGNAQTASPDSDRGELVDVVPRGEPEVKKRGDKEADASSPDKLGHPNGEITSDSDIESSYVYINKDIAEEHAMMSLPDTPAAASVLVAEISVKTNEDHAETTTAPAGANAAEIATTIAGAAPARESSGNSSFSGSGRSLLGRSPPAGSTAPSCSSRDQSIERVLEADAALLRQKRADKSTPKTPGSAGSRASAGTVRSPKETPRRFKRFLSFGKKNNRAREATVTDDCNSVADDNGGEWQSAGSIKPRMGSSDAASDDDTDHGHATPPRVSAACSLQSLVAASPAKSELAEIVPHQVKSPKAHRSFFSFRSINCGRG